MLAYTLNHGDLCKGNKRLPQAWFLCTAIYLSFSQSFSVDQSIPVISEHFQATLTCFFVVPLMFSQAWTKKFLKYMKCFSATIIDTKQCHIM